MVDFIEALDEFNSYNRASALLRGVDVYTLIKAMRVLNAHGRSLVYNAMRQPLWLYTSMADAYKATWLKALSQEHRAEYQEIVERANLINEMNSAEADYNAILDRV